MFATSHSVFFHQLKEKKVIIQISTTQGVPKIIISGMASRVVRESKDRIISCLKSLQVKLKSCKTVINLMPTDIPKKENHLELALVAAVLASYKLITISAEDCFIGSIGLKGEVYPVSKVVALVLAAKQLGFNTIFVSSSDLAKLRQINDLKLIGLSNVSQLLTATYKPKINKASQYAISPHESDVSLKKVIGNKTAIRALQIAAAGRHNIFLNGPPGYGKTLLAHCLQSIMPPLNYEQILSVAKTYSLAGLEEKLCSSPPFRQLNLNTTVSSFLGNANRNKLGELHLCSHGILFLDEINNFSKELLNAVTFNLCETGKNFVPLESERTPFLLIAAANPCPCGYYGTSLKACRCSLISRQRYQQKLSGALLDRIDLFVNVNESVINQSGFGNVEQRTTQEIAQEVVVARERLENTWAASILQDYSQLKLADSNLLSNQSLKTLHKAKVNLKLSNRLVFKTIRIAQTIASLDGDCGITEESLLEALSYRCKN